MKIAISGKGGVGKTTLAGALAKLYLSKGCEVIAIDADPDANLAFALGLGEKALSVTPLSEMEKLIEERTGAKKGSFGSYFKLNPRVDDIPEKFALKDGNLKLLVMGGVTKGGEGCVCPESALLKALLEYLLLERGEVLVIDMEAGLEHLGRATAGGVDALIVVVEPDQRSLKTAKTIKKLALDIGIDKIWVVLNKVMNEKEKELLFSTFKKEEVLGAISYSPKIRQADLEGISAFDFDKNFVEEIKEVEKRLEQKLT